MCGGGGGVEEKEKGALSEEPRQIVPLERGNIPVLYITPHVRVTVLLIRYSKSYLGRTDRY